MPAEQTWPGFDCLAFVSLPWVLCGGRTQGWVDAADLMQERLVRAGAYTIVKGPFDVGDDPRTTLEIGHEGLRWCDGVVFEHRRLRRQFYLGNKFLLAKPATDWADDLSDRFDQLVDLIRCDTEHWRAARMLGDLPAQDDPSTRWVFEDGRVG